MTNEQLAILLKGIKARLETAFEQAYEVLPNSEQLMLRLHITKDCAFGPLHTRWCRDPTHWEESPRQYPAALNPVADLIDELSREIELLTKTKD
jgi:hypothetical protein